MRKSTLSALIALLAAVPLLVGSFAVPAGGQAKKGSKDLYVIGGYDVAGEAAVAFNYFDDGAKLAVRDLEKQGYNVRYERIPSSATLCSSGAKTAIGVSSRVCGRRRRPVPSTLTTHRSHGAPCASATAGASKPSSPSSSVRLCARMG